MTLEQAVDVLNASKYHRAVYRISRPGWVTGHVVGESYDASVMPADAAIAMAEKLSAKVGAPSPDLSVLRERLLAEKDAADDLHDDCRVAGDYKGMAHCVGRIWMADRALALLDDVKAGEGK